MIASRHVGRPITEVCLLGARAPECSGTSSFGPPPSPSVRISILHLEWMYYGRFVYSSEQRLSLLTNHAQVPRAQYRRKAPPAPVRAGQGAGRRCASAWPVAEFPQGAVTITNFSDLDEAEDRAAP